MSMRNVMNTCVVAHCFNIEVSPKSFKFNPLPSMKPSSKLRFRIAEHRRELPV